MPASKRWDAATGLYYSGARYYDPEIGRFISRDPAFDGLNWFVYARSNPLRYVDPTGLRTLLREDGYVIATSDDGDLGVYMTGRGSEITKMENAATKRWDEFKRGDVIPVNPPSEPQNKIKVSEGYERHGPGGVFDREPIYATVGFDTNIHTGTLGVGAYAGSRAGVRLPVQGTDLDVRLGVTVGKGAEAKLSLTGADGRFVTFTICPWVGFYWEVVRRDYAPSNAPLAY